MSPAINTPTSNKYLHNELALKYPLNTLVLKIYIWHGLALKTYLLHKWQAWKMSWRSLH
jgi:hypothetical protein